MFPSAIPIKNITMSTELSNLLSLPGELLGVIIDCSDITSIALWVQLSLQCRMLAHTKVSQLDSATVAIIPFEWILLFKNLKSISKNIVLEIWKDYTVIRSLPQVPEVNLYIAYQWVLPIPFLNSIWHLPSITRLLIGNNLFLFRGNEWSATNGLHEIWYNMLGRRFPHLKYVSLEYKLIPPPFCKLLCSYPGDAHLAVVLEKFGSNGVLPYGSMKSIIRLYDLETMTRFFPELSVIRPDEIECAYEHLEELLQRPFNAKDLPEYNLPEVTFSYEDLQIIKGLES